MDQLPLRPDIAVKNFEYITYATPNKAAFEILDPEYQEINLYSRIQMSWRILRSTVILEPRRMISIMHSGRKLNHSNIGKETGNTGRNKPS